jgi:hypothetical protein
MTEFLVPIAFFALIFGIVYLSIRRKERMALIEKGMTPSSFNSNVHPLTNLKWGLFLVGLGVGLIIANVFVQKHIMDEEAAYFSMIFLFGGLALIISYFLGHKKSMKDRIDN